MMRNIVVAAACMLAACGQPQSSETQAREAGSAAVEPAAAQAPASESPASESAAASPAAIAPTAQVAAAGAGGEPARAAPTRAAEAPPPANPASDTLPVRDAGEVPSPTQSLIAALPAPFSEGNYESGRQAFRLCGACHSIAAGGGNRVGPNLHGILGRASGVAPGFNYSAAMENAHLSWDAATLDRFLANPRALVPGTSMTVAGVTDDARRRDLIAYLAVESQR